MKRVRSSPPERPVRPEPAATGPPIAVLASATLTTPCLKYPPTPQLPHTGKERSPHRFRFPPSVLNCASLLVGHRTGSPNSPPQALPLHPHQSPDGPHPPADPLPLHPGPRLWLESHHGWSRSVEPQGHTPPRWPVGRRPASVTDRGMRSLKVHPK